METLRPTVLRTSVVLLAIVALAGCRSLNVRGSGASFEVDHEIGTVREVVVNGIGELHIQNGAQTHLVVLAQEEIHQHLEIRNVGDRLTIAPKRGYQLRPTDELRYLLTTDDLLSIDVGGAVDVTIQEYRTESLVIDAGGSTDLDMNLRAETVTIDAGGSTDLGMSLRAETVTIDAGGSFDGRLSGEATHLTLDFSGSATLNAYDFTAQHADISMSGSSDVYITAIESLNVSSSGSSDVSYRGNPRLDLSSAGASSVTPAE